jgi:hypothetical protein
MRELCSAGTLLESSRMIVDLQTLTRRNVALDRLNPMDVIRLNYGAYVIDCDSIGDIHIHAVEAHDRIETRGVSRPEPHCATCTCGVAGDNRLDARGRVIEQGSLVGSITNDNGPLLFIETGWLGGLTAPGEIVEWIKRGLAIDLPSAFDYVITWERGTAHVRNLWWVHSAGCVSRTCQAEQGCPR